MVEIENVLGRTAAAILKAYEVDEEWQRPHLGASEIGDEKCHRALWYSFRWASKPQFDGRKRRLMRRGDIEEEWLKNDLRYIGITVLDEDPDQPVDPETGKRPQFSYRAVNGHFGGSCDGKVLGVIEAPKTWHVLEAKSVKSTRHANLVKHGCEKAEPGIWVQCQCYMHGFGPTRCLLLAVNKDTDEIFQQRIRYDPAVATSAEAVAELVIYSDVPPERISNDPTWFVCKFCDFREICHKDNTDALVRSCRTCVSGVPKPDGMWHCSQDSRPELGRLGASSINLSPVLDIDAQRTGCDVHLFLPELLPGRLVDGDDNPRDDRRWTIYQRADGTRFMDRDRRLVEERDEPCESS